MCALVGPTRRAHGTARVHAAVRGAHEVLLMGEETLTPVGKAKFADRRVRRRTTEIWTDASGTWQLSVRQATIHSAE